MYPVLPFTSFCSRTSTCAGTFCCWEQTWLSSKIGAIASLGSPWSTPTIACQLRLELSYALRLLCISIRRNIETQSISKTSWEQEKTRFNAVTSFLTSNRSLPCTGFCFLSLIRLKNESFNDSGKLRLLISTLVLVAITYIWLMRRSGQPLSLNGPVTSKRPDLSCFKNTTRYDRKYSY